MFALKASMLTGVAICLLACEEENTQIQNFNNKGGRFAQAVYISRELRGRTAGRLSFSHLREGVVGARSSFSGRRNRVNGSDRVI